MGFTKLDEGILQSSIMAENSDVFKTFIAILAACKQDGVARVSSIYLASVCHLPLDVVDKAIATLEAPDPRSRSLVEKGRRIRRVDGGYFVINHGRYRAFDYSNKPEAIRQRRHRAKVMERDMSRDISASASASVSASSRPNKSIDKPSNNLNAPQSAPKPSPTPDQALHIEEIQTVFDQFNYHVHPDKPLKVGDPDCDRGMAYANERLSDGYSVGDLCHVIEVMTEAWTGDLHMRKFLRPEVLFSKGKFAGYLAKRTLAQEGQAWAAEYAANHKEEA
jgi:uncharacterized phage protein (TIGR02220 family)